ncbi:MAG: hypothetical protein AAF492_20665, partial [Verrucomicrobiota bacterium]
MIDNGKMSIFIEKIEPSVGSFSGRAAQVTPNAHNWNPPTTEHAEWDVVDFIDGGLFNHSPGADPESIVVQESGDYLLVYNDSLFSVSAARSNPHIGVEVNGVPVAGAETKTHWIRNSNGHNVSSGSLVFYLDDLAAGSTVRVSVVRGQLSGTVDLLDEAILYLVRKGPGGSSRPVLGVPYVTDITTDAATIGVHFDGADAAYDLTLYLGNSDGGTNPAAWDMAVPFGWLTNQVGVFSNTFVGLTAGEHIYFSWQASNCANEVWSDSPRDFYILGPPRVGTGLATMPGIGSARIHTRLTEGQPAEVIGFWGDHNGGNDPYNWDHAESMGIGTNGVLNSVVISGLLFGVQYWNHAYATNDFGDDWGFGAASWFTMIPNPDPIINQPATFINDTSAVLNADFVGAGAVYEVSVFWGPTDGGTDPASWSNTSSFGTFSDFTGP